MATLSSIITPSNILTASNTATLTNKTINFSSNTLVATSAQLAAAVTDETGTGALVFASSPVLGGIVATASGNLRIDPATQIVEVLGDGASVVGQIQLNCHVNSHGQRIASQPHSQAAYNTLTLPGGTTIGDTNATLVSDIGTQTLTNKTIAFGSNTLSDVASLSAVQTFTGTKSFSGTSSTLAMVLKNTAEVATVSAIAATGTINYDITIQSVLFFTTDASANFTVNFRASSGTSLNTAMTTGQSVTAAFLVTNGATAYYNNVIQVDGSTVTPKFQGGTAYAAGNASSIDVYMYTIIKTGNATFTVFTSQTKFA